MLEPERYLVAKHFSLGLFPLAKLQRRKVRALQVEPSDSVILTESLQENDWFLKFQR